MKNKKRKFLIPLVPVLLLGIAGASLGTVAWFEATRNIVAGDSEKALDVEPSAVQLGDIKFYLEPPSSSLPAIELSDDEGNRWALVRSFTDGNWYYQSVPSESFEGTYGTIPLSARAMKQSGDTEIEATAADLKPYEHELVTFDVYGNSRTRVSYTAPSDSDMSVYSNKPGDVLEVTVEILSVNVSTGEITYQYNSQSNISIYYSVSGGENVPVEGGVCPLTDVDPLYAPEGIGHVYIGKYKVHPEDSFGKYPSSRVFNENLIAELNELTPDDNNYVELDDVEYKKCEFYVNDEINFAYYKVEPIKWTLVDDNYNGTALYISNFNLDCKPFNLDEGTESNPGNNYANSDIREWLNNDFLNEAFDTSEQEFIVKDFIDNSPQSTAEDENPYACEDTEDKIFLLSFAEIQAHFDVLYFMLDNTDYTNFLTSEDESAWMTRTPNHYSYNTFFRCHSDGGGDTGSPVNVCYAVRPALRISLN